MYAVCVLDANLTLPLLFCRVEKSLVTFPAVPEYFTMEAPCFLRKCFKCNEPEQKMVMKYDRFVKLFLITSVRLCVCVCIYASRVCHLLLDYICRTKENMQLKLC